MTTLNKESGGLVPTLRQRYPVVLGVEVASDPLQLALPLSHVLNRRRLHEESVGACIRQDLDRDARKWILIRT